jgi:DNA-binding response OmpR family regulator
LDYQVTETASLTRVLRDKRAQLVFVAGDSANYRETVRALLAARGDLPVILVNRFPENGRWLDALELGATDYCGAPFEKVQMQWLVEGALRRVRTAAAA